MQRGIHNIHRSFAFRSNPKFIFHDSPGFETGDEKQLREVLSFIERKARSIDVDDQLHAIWSVLLSQRTYWSLIVKFCVEKVLFYSEQCSATIATGDGVFWDGEGRKRFLSWPSAPIFQVYKLTFYSTRRRDLYQIRWSDDSDLWHWSRRRCQSPKCGGTSGTELQKTIVRVCLSTKCWCLLRRQVLVDSVPKWWTSGSMFNV